METLVPKYTPPIDDDQRYLRNGELAAYLGISRQTLGRWKKDLNLDTPPSMDVNGIERNDREAWDEWMKSRAVANIAA
jgi:predicted DNA-binding transcriptional regulator AlpA